VYLEHSWDREREKLISTVVRLIKGGEQRLGTDAGSDEFNAPLL
jgi:hypothetical protein